MNESDFEFVEGSGNVFRDLGDPDADLKQAKAISRAFATPTSGALPWTG